MYICRFVEHKKSVRKFPHGDEYHYFVLLKCVCVFPLKNQPVELCIEGVLWKAVLAVLCVLAVWQCCAKSVCCVCVVAVHCSENIVNIARCRKHRLLSFSIETEKMARPWPAPLQTANVSLLWFSLRILFNNSLSARTYPPLGNQISFLCILDRDLGKLSLFWAFFQ